MYELEVLPARAQAPFDDAPIARWRTEAGEVAATFHHRPGGYAIRFVERADFAVSLSDARVSCVPVPGASEQSVRDLFLNQVVPLIRAHQGELVVHASAVAVGGAAILFVGQSGRGKSTLAAAFAKASMPFLSDDGVVLTSDGSRYVVAPNRPSFRLWQDSQLAIGARLELPDEDEQEKSSVQAGEDLPFHAAPLPLRAFYFLGPGLAGKVRIEPLSRRQALADLINHSFLLDVADHVRLRDHFETLAVLAESVPSFAFDYPRDYARLPEVIDAVLAHVSTGEPVL